jgi:hypothetical protein
MIIFNDFPGSVLRGDDELWKLLSRKFIDLNCTSEPETFNKILDETFQTIIEEGKKMDEDLVFFESFKRHVSWIYIIALVGRSYTTHIKVKVF